MRTAALALIALLAIGSVSCTETDELVPCEVQRRFIADLRRHYEGRGADPSLIEFVTFADTGAPQEHSGFGRYGAKAKDAATAFLTRRLLGIET